MNNGGNNLAPHLRTYQRNTLSKQILDGFLIFHVEEDQYEQWDRETQTWKAMLDSDNASGAGGNETVSGSMSGSTLTLTKANGDQVVITGIENQGEHDHFLSGTVGGSNVTDPEALDDWGNA